MTAADAAFDFFTLDPAVEAHALREIILSVVPAKAGTHGKYLKVRCFWLAWIPDSAGMTP
jgi:hypothetical protein